MNHVSTADFQLGVEKVSEPRGTRGGAGYATPMPTGAPVQFAERRIGAKRFADTIHMQLSVELLPEFLLTPLYSDIVEGARLITMYEEHHVLLAVHHL